MPDGRYSVRAMRLSYELKDPPTRARAIAEIRAAIQATGGNLRQAAFRLGVSRIQLYRWIVAFQELGNATDRARNINRVENTK